MDEQPYLTPTNSFIGVASEFKCYPTTIQELQFEQGGSGVHRVLGTRTLEGLLIELDVHIEYRIVPEEARQLYEQFGEWYYVTSNLTLISRSVLRNTASRYGGLEYMTGDRAQIAAGMQADLNVAFAQFHATISEVNIRHITLTPAFEAAFAAVRAIKLDASKALETREVDISQERRSNESDVITLLADRETIVLQAQSELVRAELQRAASITSKQTTISTAKLKAETNRETVLTHAKSEVNKAQSERQARLTEARVRNSEETLKAENQRGVVLIEAATKVATSIAKRGALVTSAQTAATKARLEAERRRETALTAARGRLATEKLRVQQLVTQALGHLDSIKTSEAAREQQEGVAAAIVKLSANASASALQETEGARVEGLKAFRTAENAFFKALQTEAGLSRQQVLRFLHLQALGSFPSDDSDGAFFVDYNKVPLMLEAAGESESATLAVSADAKVH